ncbi:HAD-IB family hydrolase [Helcobacillus sp. ACRRO]|uniref:HAD-IB family hydrolase n=1 Tax=Helcobacillus sp. ACRRO TaxID=2918202 RepID=UPI001EF58273|nr:HAD-IB family hydrolase [Helcobacillus sp. ACRRO]MCG7428186.1 HAD-IB family hydrolase [Helcobacillus sp. ACRRO]
MANAHSQILLTGVTGFLGQAVLQDLLENHPDVRVTAVIRPKGSQTGRKRLEGLLRKPVFTSWAERTSKEEVASALADRVDVLEGDLTAMPPLTQKLDVVIHSASSVSFDPPINEAFATNVGGAKNLYEALLESDQDPHVIHVSTAYVSGLAKGLRREGRLTHTADWRAEYDMALAAKDRVEAQSRTPEVLRRLMRRAAFEAGKMGPKASAEVAERARQDWVHERLQDYGLQRANSLGWTDIYTFTKAMAERVAEELWAQKGHRLSVVRPSIIESALRRPYPGWLDGYKVADPLIMAYGNGRLPEFPGLADSILDIIPVDFIVNVITALATQDVSRRGDDAYFQVVSGSSNPLPFHEMVSAVQGYFQEHPLTDDDGSPIEVPTWSFPSVQLIEARFWATQKAAKTAQLITSQLPGTKRTRQWAGQLHRTVSGLETLRKFTDLYRHYTKTEMVFDDANTRALREELPADFLATNDFDVTVINWKDFFQKQHLPALTELTKAYKRAKSAQRRREARGPAALKEGSDVLAVFDLDGTVIAQNIVQQYLSIMRATRPRRAWAAESAKLASALPQYLLAESRDRSEFIRSVNRRYRGYTPAELRGVLSGELGEKIRASIRDEARARIEEHRKAGHRTVLVTGALDLLVEPIADLFDDVVATRMHLGDDGRLTGYLATPPVVDEARANWLRKYADEHGLDLTKSYGYGDSVADASWLRLLGHPSAISPDLGLYAEAKKQRWQVLDWK